MSRMEDTSEMDGLQRRHCWECLRLCLVCDFARPVCNRCSISGTLCPGYEDPKPTRLRWLAPGRVKSRQKRRGRATLESSDDNPLQKETRIMRNPSRTTEVALRPFFHVETELYALFEAVDYYNACIYRDLVPMQQLGRNSQIYSLSPAHLQLGRSYPEYLRLGLICTTLTHRMCRSRNTQQSRALGEAFYRCRGDIIRTLHQDISGKGNQASDVVLAGVMALLLSDAQHFEFSNWRYHFEGLRFLINLRGGVRVLSRIPALQPLIMCFMFLAVTGNTTSPAPDLVMTGSCMDELEFIQRKPDDAASPTHFCCPPLFAEIVKINHIRMRAAKEQADGVTHLTPEAYEILDRIENFFPTQWADSKKSSKQDWVCLGEVYSAATGLYCISSLQSLCVLSTTPSLTSSSELYGRKLQALLQTALFSQKLKRFMLWPLIVLGVEARNECSELRNFIVEQLEEMGRYGGTNSPLLAKCVLEKFWASGKLHWDDCFDMPYTFPMQIAVDISQIMPI